MGLSVAAPPSSEAPLWGFKWPLGVWLAKTCWLAAVPQGPPQLELAVGQSPGSTACPDPPPGPFSPGPAPGCWPHPQCSFPPSVTVTGASASCCRAGLS